MLERVRAVWAAFCIWAYEWFWERPWAAWNGLTLMQWRSQRRRTREIQTEAETAVAAARMDTVEGDMQVSVQRPAFNAEIERLLLIPKRSTEEERRLLWLQRTVREIDDLIATRGLPLDVVGNRPLAAFGAVGQPRRFAALAGVAGWQIWAVVGAVAAAGWVSAIWQTRELRLEQAESANATRIANENAEAARGWREQYERAHSEVIEAQKQAATTRENLEATNRRNRARARRDQEINRATQELLVNDTPPPWDRLLRGDEPDPGAPPGGGDAGAPGHSR